MRFALDSNILIYAEGAEEDAKRERALWVIDRAGRGNLVLPLQIMGETLRWLIRKGRLDRTAAVERVSTWIDQYELLAVSAASFRMALDLVNRHAFQVWDAVILAASSEAGAAVLFSEDMQHGFRWGGVTIVNPFALSQGDLLALIPEQSTMH